MRKPLDLLDRLADKFLVGDGCWPWQGPSNSSGYGSIRLNVGFKQGVTRGAHVVLYELMVGPIPEGLELDHLCRNKRCVRPDHLEPVTRAENNRRNPSSRFNQLAARTHCSQGHEYTEENTFWRKDNGGRKCRICSRAAGTRSYHRRKHA